MGKNREKHLQKAIPNRLCEKVISFFDLCSSEIVFFSLILDMILPNELDLNALEMTSTGHSMLKFFFPNHKYYYLYEYDGILCEGWNILCHCG